MRRGAMALPNDPVVDDLLKEINISRDRLMMTTAYRASNDFIDWIAKTAYQVKNSGKSKGNDVNIAKILSEESTFT